MRTRKPKTNRYDGRSLIRPWSIGECPTGEMLRDAWLNKSRSQKDFIWLLSVLGELECFLDYSLEHKGGFGNIEGRRGGLKEFIEKEVPDLIPKYKSISRHMKLAKGFKRAYNIFPPATISLVHYELPVPDNMPSYIVNFARKLYRRNLSTLPPEWKAFNKRVQIRLKHATKFMTHPWGKTPWPREKWKDIEKGWHEKCVRCHAIKDMLFWREIESERKNEDNRYKSCRSSARCKEKDDLPDYYLMENYSIEMKPDRFD